MTEPKTILYVDDDEDDRDILREVFLEHRYQLQTLASGKALFGVLPDLYEKVCLIVLDINMPGDNGLDVLRALKEEELYEPIPVVMLTTGGNSPQSHFLESIGVGVVAKPNSYVEVNRLADRLLTFCLTKKDTKKPL